MTTNEVDEFNATLRALERTMERHLAALRIKKKTDEKAETEKQAAAPVPVTRTYSRLRRENTTTGCSNSGPIRPDKVCEYNYTVESRYQETHLKCRPYKSSISMIISV